MDKNILKSTRSALAALDYSNENAEIEALEADMDRAQEAIDRAQQRCSEISTALTQNVGPNALAVADALLDGSEARHAAATGPGEDDLRKERESLRAGMGELTRQIDDYRREIAEVRTRARRRAIETVQPLVDALVDDMRASASQLIDGFAAIAAVNEMTGGSAMVRYAAGQAATGVAGPDKLLRSQRNLDVPAEIIDALAGLEGKGKSLPVRLTSVVPAP